MRFFILFGALSLAVPAASAVGQEDPSTLGSRILSTDSWTYEAIEQLRLRGHLGALDPTAQPYRRIDVAAAIRAGTAPATGPVADWYAILTEELAIELARFGGSEPTEQRVGAQLRLGGTGSDSRRRDPLMPSRTDAEGGQGDRAWTEYSAGLWMEVGNVAGEARMARDRWYRGVRGDPDGLNPNGFKFLGRTDNAYATAAFAWGDVWLGRFERNWGPIGGTGVMISDNATSYPSIGLDIGRGRFSFQYMAGELDEVAGRKRYVVANRLNYGTEDFRVSVGEAALYSGTGSTLRMLNPFEAIFFDHNANNNDRAALTGNAMLQAQLWARIDDATLFAEAALDDFDLNPRTGAEDRAAEATSYQIAMGARYFGVRDDIALGLDYRLISAFSYRSNPEAEQWMVLRRGLGDPWSDYDRLTLRADLFPDVRGLRLTPVLQLQRAGEGDPRIPMPERDELLAAPGVFLGVKETTRRVALQGRFQPVRQAYAEWDIGRSFIDNAGHVEGVTEERTSFYLEVGLTFEFGLEGMN